MPTDAEIEIVSRRVQALHAERDERRAAAKNPDARPTARHLTPLQLALDAKRTGAVMRPDWATALAEHKASNEAP